MSDDIHKICFSHGQESGPWGTKIQSMAGVAQGEGWQVESLDYQGMESALDRRDKLVAWCERQTAAFVLAGSSMGGFVAMAAAVDTSPLGLFVLAPAFYVPGYEQYMPAASELPQCPTRIVHGWRDDVVPWDGSVRYGSETGAQLLMVDGDHRLTANIESINAVLRAFLRELQAGEPSS